MSHRLFFPLLVVIAAFGVGSQAIAQASQQPKDDLGLAQTTDLNAQGSSETVPTQAPSPAVQAVQRRLAQLGYYTGTTDGIFNAETQQAIAGFQQDNGLVATGILDPKTQERLRNPAPVDSPFETDTSNSDTPAKPSPEASDIPEPPEASQSELPAPQGEASPQAQSETDNGESFTDSVAAPVEAGETDDGKIVPDSDAQTGSGLSPDTETDATPSSEQSVVPSILWGLAIMAVGTLGTGIVLLLAKRGQSKPPKFQGGSKLQEGRFTTPQAAASTFPTPPPAPPPSTHLQNGHQALPTEVANSSVQVQRGAHPLEAPSEARLAKINIIDELIQDLEKPDPAIRHKAIWELGQRGNSAAVQPLMGLLMEADSNEQSLILAALSEITMKTLKPMSRAAAVALRDENPEVRKNAIRDLTRVYDSLGRVGRILGHATADSDPDVRQTAHWALEQINHIRLAPTESPTLFEGRSGSRESLPEDGSSSHRA